MFILIYIWLFCGLAHWLNYMVFYNPKFIILDLIFGLPFFILVGPISFLRRLF